MEEDFPIKNSNDDIIKTFLTLYKLGVNLDKIPNKEQIKKLLIKILYLAKLLDFTLEDLEKETRRKSEIIQKRLNSDY